MTSRKIALFSVCAAFCMVLTACSSSEPDPDNSNDLNSDALNTVRESIEFYNNKSVESGKIVELAAVDEETDTTGELAGYVADKDGNIVEYVYKTNPEDLPKVKTDVTTADTDIILAVLNEAASYAPVETGIEGYTFENGMKVEKNFASVRTIIPAETGSEIYALEDGVVIFAEFRGLCGYTVCVKNSEGSYILYAHLSETAAEKDGEVVKGQVIGYAGTTGAAYFPCVEYISGDTLSKITPQF